LTETLISSLTHNTTVKQMVQNQKIEELVQIYVMTVPEIPDYLNFNGEYWYNDNDTLRLYRNREFGGYDVYIVPTPDGVYALRRLLKSLGYPVYAHTPTP